VVACQGFATHFEEYAFVFGCGRHDDV